MRILWMVIRQHFKANLQYSKTFWITAIAAPISMLVFIVLFKSIFAHNHTTLIKGYTLEQMIWYFAAGSIIWSLTWTNSDWRLSSKILNGELAVDLLRPLSVFKLEIGNAIAHRLVAFLLEFLPCLLVFSLIVFPSFLTAVALLKFFAAIVFAFLLNFLANFLIGLAAFGIKNTRSLNGLKWFLQTTVGGYFIPLEFFPGWAQKVAAFLPFRYIYYWPVQFILNRDLAQGTGAFLSVLTAQLLWVLGLFCLCKLIWRYAIRKFCAVGG